MHDSQGDCWLAINGKVYDVSEYTTHPGGVAILEGCGMDATELFETRPMGSGTPHSDDARSYMDNYYIGELA
ncbi:MAG: cytochrome b5 domain-containing protein [Nanoarchaeota archaeon]|nr:cytochrome b5 domain-containing protein [Nanoarchaeota archaeon]